MQPLLFRLHFDASRDKNDLMPVAREVPPR
jgi:hypothetical protein